MRGNGTARCRKQRLDFALRVFHSGSMAQARAVRLLSGLLIVYTETFTLHQRIVGRLTIRLRNAHDDPIPLITLRITLRSTPASLIGPESGLH